MFARELCEISARIFPTDSENDDSEHIFLASAIIDPDLLPHFDEFLQMCVSAEQLRTILLL